MTPAAARRRVWTNRLAGALIMLVCAAFLFTGSLLWIYNKVDLAGAGVASLSGDLRRLAYFVYRHTQFLSLAWEHAPVPDARALLSRGTLTFLGWYAGFFVGASLLAAGNTLARRLRGADAAHGVAANGAARPAMHGPSAQIRNQPFWREVWTLYVAPVGVGLLCWMLIELARRTG